MSYHSTVYTNKDIKKHFTEDQLKRLTLISITGKSAKTKNAVKWNGNIATVFGSGFVARLALKVK